MAEILIYDEIMPKGFWGVSTDTIMQALEENKTGEQVVRINSPGGDVVEAIAMYNALRRWEGKIVVEIDSRAASAASLLAMAGDEIRIAENAEMMLHEPYIFAAVNYNGIEFLGERLSDYRNRTADMYAARSGRTRDEILGVYNDWDGTYFDAQEAVEFGLADSIGQKLNVQAKTECRAWQLNGREAPDPKPAASVLAEMRHKERDLELMRLR